MANKARANRLRLSKLYGHLYRRAPKVNWEKCVYCGDNMQVWDHCPPLILTEDLNIDDFKNSGKRFLLFPCCLKCNSLLLDFPETNIYERFDYLLKKYTKKYNRLPNWTDEELSEMGSMLRKYIIANRDKNAWIETKIKKLIENFTSDEFIDFI